MIDWNKPLEWRGEGIFFVGRLPKGAFAALYSYSWGLVTVCTITGAVKYNNTITYVTNKVEPWEEAFKQYTATHHYDRAEEYIFKKGFEAGRSCNK